MSNHSFQDKTFTLERKKVSLFAVIDIGASGAPTLEAWNPSAFGKAGFYTAAATAPIGPAPAGFAGVYGIVRNAAGDYTVTLQQSYQRLLGVNVTQLLSSAATGVDPTATPVVTVIPAGIGSYSGTNVGVQATPATGGGYVEILFGAAAGTLNAGAGGVDPSAGTQLLIEFVLGDSTAI